MDAPAVSVVMPVRNAADTLAVSLASITAQTLKEWELIAVPDRCDDNSLEILNLAAASDPRVRIVQPKETGLVEALNAGVAAARAPLIARFDADDECEPERLEEQLQFLRANPRIGACGSLVRFGGNPFTQLGYALHVEWINSLVAPEDIALNRFIESPVAHPSMMFRSELVQMHDGYRNGPFPEDYELWLRWMDAGVVFGKVQQALLTWNDPPGRLSRIDPRYSPEAFYECKCHYLARWLKRERPNVETIFLWGAGRPTRKRFASLRDEGIEFAGYVDVDAKKIGGRIGDIEVHGPDVLPPAAEGAFVIVGVGTRGARQLIREELFRHRYREGIHFICAA